MIIKEIWIPAINNEGYVEHGEYEAWTVISMGKKTVYGKDNSKEGELLSALVYDPESGQLSEVMMIDAYIKTLENEVKELIRFDKPRVGNQTGRA